MAEVMKKAQLIGIEKRPGVIPRNKGVQAAVQLHAENIYGKAEINLAKHRLTGNARVGMNRSHGGGVDRYVYLEDAFPGNVNKQGEKVRHSPSAIEFGYTQKTRFGEREVPGTWILHDASGYPRPNR